MLQPFEPFKAMYIPGLVEQQKFYLVSQLYRRYEDELFEGEARTCLLLTSYADLNLAKTHAQALRGDKYAAVLDLQKAAHRNKLAEMTRPGSRYHVFWAVVKSTRELEEKLNRKYSDHLRRYIIKRTSWRISRDSTLRPTFQLLFGEIFIILKYGGQMIRVKFEDIESA